MKTFMVDKDKIKEIIGKELLLKECKEKIRCIPVDVNDDGVVSVFGQNQSSMKECLLLSKKFLKNQN